MDNLGIFMAYHQEYYMVLSKIDGPPIYCWTFWLRKWWSAMEFWVAWLSDKPNVRQLITDLFTQRGSPREGLVKHSEGQRLWEVSQVQVDWTWYRGFQLFKDGRKDWIISRFNDPFALLLMVYRYLMVDHFSILLVKMAALCTYWIYSSVYIYIYVCTWVWCKSPDHHLKFNNPQVEVCFEGCCYWNLSSLSYHISYPHIIDNHPLNKYHHYNIAMKCMIYQLNGYIYEMVIQKKWGCSFQQIRYIHVYCEVRDIRTAMNILFTFI